jgi:stage II sporulation protein D
MRKLVLTALALAATAARLAAGASPEFRVEVFSHAAVKSLTLEADRGPIKLCGAKSDGPCLTLPPTKIISCAEDRGIVCPFNAKDWRFTFLQADSPAPFRIAPASADPQGPPLKFWVQNVRIAATTGQLKMTTQVDLEPYVSGVLRGEASVLHAPAARRAMAIAARTWALRSQGRHQAAGFDFCSLTHCQVFRLAEVGEGGAPLAIDPAVEATRGMVLLYHRNLADPYFTASCGGMTEAAGNIWPDRAEPYLISVHDPYCRAGSHAEWSQSLTSANVQVFLRESLRLPISGPVTNLSVEKRDSSGRATVLRVAAGGAWEIDANEFRYAIGRRLGWQQIKSNLYTIERRGDSWIFSGHGMGHGVGLCQEGAEQMAKMGSSTDRILSTYFPGTEISKEPMADADPIASSEHFELIYYSSQEAWVKKTLDGLEQWRRELGTHADTLPSRVRVQTFETVADFMRATGEPGWMAAVSDGQSIELQPLQLLDRKEILTSTLRHELSHLVVHRVAEKGVPRWFEEGCVLYLSRERVESPSRTMMSDRELNDAITHPRSEGDLKAAYSQALERVRQFAQEQGEDGLWRALSRPDLIPTN